MKKILLALLCFIEALTVTSNELGYFNPIQTNDVSVEAVNNINDPAVIDAYTHIFADNVYHLSQQRNSHLLPYVEMVGLVRAAQSINRIGVLDDPRPYEARMATVKGTNPQNDVRWVTAQPYYHACFIDDYDQIRTLFSLQNAYTVAISKSFGRFYDRTIIAAAHGIVCSGPNRTAQIPLPPSQKTVATDGTAFTGLNLATLRRIRLKQKANFAHTRGDTMLYIISATETDSLLSEVQVTSRDYSNLLALQAGEVIGFMGMQFVETQLVPNNSEEIKFNPTTGDVDSAGTGTVEVGKARMTFTMVAGQSICFGINSQLNGLVTRIPQRHNNWMIYYRTEIGAVRKEEVGVRAVYTLDSLVA